MLYLDPDQWKQIHISVIWNPRQMREYKVEVSQMCWGKKTTRKKSEQFGISVQKKQHLALIQTSSGNDSDCFNPKAV